MKNFLLITAITFSAILTACDNDESFTAPEKINGIESSSSKKAETLSSSNSTECPDETQCENIVETDISTWAFTVKDAEGNDENYVNETKYVEIDEYGGRNYTKTEVFSINANGFKNLIFAWAYQQGDSLNYKDGYKIVKSACIDRVQQQHCRNPQADKPNAKDTTKINCYATYMKLENGDSLKVAECDDGRLWLYNSDDIISKKYFSEHVGRTIPYYDENYAVNCHIGSQCYDYVEQGERKGGCVPSIWCPEKSTL